MENDKGFKISQYACAVLLIVSSIALVAYQVVEIDDVAGGLLYYVAQSFLLAGSIFGLDQYLRIINFLKASPHTDQLLTGSTWLHISWNPFAQPRHFVRLGYYR